MIAIFFNTMMVAVFKEVKKKSDILISFWILPVISICLNNTINVGYLMVIKQRIQTYCDSLRRWLRCWALFLPHALYIALWHVVLWINNIQFWIKCYALEKKPDTLRQLRRWMRRRHICHMYLYSTIESSILYAFTTSGYLFATCICALLNVRIKWNFVVHTCRPLLCFNSTIESISQMHLCFYMTFVKQ